MSDTAVPPSEPSTPVSSSNGPRRGVVIGVAAAGVIVLAAIVTLVLVVSLGILGDTPLPATDASKALLNSADLSTVTGARIASGRDTQTLKYSLQQYARENPVGSADTVSPARCASNVEGWMAWASLDTPSYRGWKSDTIYAAENIRVDSVADYGDDVQEARHFVTTAAATAFMSAQRAWYRDCATVTYSDPDDATNDATFAFAPIAAHLGLDSIVEGSVDRGSNVAPHLVDVYLRNQNIVYVTELVTSSNPRSGLDRVSQAVVLAAAKNVRGLPG